VCHPFSTIVEMEIDQQLEQWINVKFVVKLGKSGPEICQMLQHSYGEDALKRSTVFKWVQLMRRLKTSRGQQKVRVPFHFNH
jgi:hypothetical protein